jgi:phosphohistidine phosphatase
MPMLELYLIRHGVAAERGDQYPDDSKRPLTTRGLAQLRRQAKALARLGVTFDLIVTSPLVRTRQTAEVFADVLEPTPAVTSSEALAPDGTTGAVVQELSRLAAEGRVALVGHEPNLGALAARLSGAKAPFEFKKGAVCRIDFDALPAKAPGTLRWFVTARMLRNLK